MSNMLERVTKEARTEIYREVGGRNSKKTAEHITQMIVLDVIHNLHRTGHNDAANEIMGLYFPMPTED